MDIITRLNEILKSSGLSNSQFAEKLEVPKPSLSQILNGRNKKISNEFIERIHHAFPELNIMWLLFGQGNMWITNDFAFANQNNNTIPFVNANSLIKEPDDYPTDKAIIISNVNSEEISANKSNELTQDSSSLYSEQNANEKYARNTDDPNLFDFSENYGQDSSSSHTNAKKEIMNELEKSPLRKIKSIVIYYSDCTYEVFHNSDKDNIF